MAGSITVASAEGSASPGISWTTKFGDSYLVVSLAAGEVMAIVVLVFVLTAAFLALCLLELHVHEGPRFGSARPGPA